MLRMAWKLNHKYIWILPNFESFLTLLTSSFMQSYRKTNEPSQYIRYFKTDQQRNLPTDGQVRLLQTPLWKRRGPKVGEEIKYEKTFLQGQQTYLEESLKGSSIQCAMLHQLQYFYKQKLQLFRNKVLKLTIKQKKTRQVYNGNGYGHFENISMLLWPNTDKTKERGFRYTLERIIWKKLQLAQAIYLKLLKLVDCSRSQSLSPLPSKYWMNYF